ncbi:MAG TPA: hypothetical protein VN493_16930 [Thermoanaerobaculia bacterium]|nr:hypothetical protein [Thermoanaerobaculia bacterium]
MARHPVLRFAVLVVALSLLLPLAAVEASCTDCLWAASPDCCPQPCCPCCVHSPALAGIARAHVALAEIGLAGNPFEDRTLPSNPCDVFHVPKPSLV